jgi:Putative Ig domain
VKTAFVVGILFLLFAPIAAEAQCLLTYETEVIPAFYVGVPGNFQIVGVSGTEPYKFEIFDGVLPEGLHLTPSGRIVGVPQAESETVVFITITDAAGCSLTQAFNVVVLPKDQQPQ